MISLIIKQCIMEFSCSAIANEIPCQFLQTLMDVVYQPLDESAL